MAKIGIDCVSILAGGGGTRLWPASTEQRPKQFMKIGADKSLLLQTLERSWGLGPRVGVFVVCNQKYAEGVREEVALLPLQQAQKTFILPEPNMCNTATALFYVNQLVEQLAGPEAMILVQTSDHLVGPPEKFSAAIGAAANLASKRRIVVFGLEPRYPATGYGYIERGEGLEVFGEQEAFEVLRFTEKPNLEMAEEFVRAGRFYWNSGMFCYTAGLFRQELQKWSPAIPKALEGASSQLSGRLRYSDSGVVLEVSPELEASYGNCQSISVDYALMEKTDRLGLLSAKFDWNDIGSWDVLADLEHSSSKGSGSEGSGLDAWGARVVEVGQSSNNFVRSKMPVALCAVKDLIVVEENGVLLICKKGASEQVKEARALLQK